MFSDLLYKIIKFQSYRVKKLLTSLYGELFYHQEILPLNKKYKRERSNKTNPQNILFINALKDKGGAAKVAYDSLYKSLKTKGFGAEFLVGNSLHKNSEDVIEFIDHYSKERKLLDKIEKKINLRDFYQHESLKIPEMDIFNQADIVHLHNLHEKYFNPFILPKLTSQKPTIWTLHDYGAFTGYCTVEYYCEKWKTGCKECPYLKRLGLKDTANYIWQKKKELYQNSYLTIVVPSVWLKDRVEQSILGHFDIKVIPHGINTEVFKPYDKQEVRSELNLPADKTILLFSADFGDKNPNKGGEYLQSVYEEINNDNVLFLSVGGDKQEQVAENFLRIPYVFSEEQMAKYYSAADLFIYPSLADTFGLAPAEAMSCGLPVVTFRTGGVPEVVRHNETGYIANFKDVNDFICGVETYLHDIEKRKQASYNARKRIVTEFSLDKMVDSYIEQYQKIIKEVCKL